MIDHDDVQPEDYTNADHQKFIEDMHDAGYTCEHYHGRFYWEGAAVRVDDFSDAMAATSVRCQFDNMGLGYIVYPKVSAPMVDKAV